MCWENMVNMCWDMCWGFFSGGVLGVCIGIFQNICVGNMCWEIKKYVFIYVFNLWKIYVLGVCVGKLTNMYSYMYSNFGKYMCWEYVLGNSEICIHICIQTFKKVCVGDMYSYMYSNFQKGMCW